MEWLSWGIDFAQHIDRHLVEFIAQHGAWIYGLLFLIIFSETGLVVMPFLPGDSLLFVAGTLCGLGSLNLGLTIAVLWLAAVCGNQSNYSIGRFLSSRVLAWRHSLWFNKHLFDQAHAFYERYGGITIVLARFMPFVRTFAPFVAGVANMTHSKFTLFDITGGGAWVASIVCVGYFFGRIPWVQDHLEHVIWGFILIPGLLALLAGLKNKLS